MHAVARLHYATLIDNIQVSWVKMGVEGSRRILQAGANDLGGTLMDENISRAAGAVHGQEMDVDDARATRRARSDGPLRQRTHPLPDARSHDDLIDEFLREHRRASRRSRPSASTILRTLLVTRLVDLVTLDPDVGDLRVAVNALERARGGGQRLLAVARARPKLTVFGSARTAGAIALYEMAARTRRRDGRARLDHRLGRRTGHHGGRGDGRGREHTLGVNIELPFEQSANPYVDAETRLVEMKYFFTRKVALTRQSHRLRDLPWRPRARWTRPSRCSPCCTRARPRRPRWCCWTRPTARTGDEWMDFIENAIVAGELPRRARDMCLVRVCTIDR